MPITNYISKKWIFVGVGLIVLLLIFALTAPEGQDDGGVSDMANTYQESQRELQSKRVFIQSFEDAEGISDNTDVQKRVEHLLFLTASQGGQNKNLYTGVLKPESYKESLSYRSTGNSLVRQFMVDVEPIKMTYLVYVREYRGNNDVNIICAPDEFQMDSSVTCKGVDWE